MLSGAKNLPFALSELLFCEFSKVKVAWMLKHGMYLWCFISSSQEDK